LIVAREPVLYPYLSRPDILVAMSQEACRKFAPGIKPGGMLLVEEDLVKPEGVPEGVRVFGVPATRLAEELRRKMVLNIVMAGFFTAITGLLRAETGRRAVSESVPPGTEALNLAAFDKGYEYGQHVLASGQAA
jgi:2-oxoglutarate ferredoxin oxidoreductase subunit gamma